jgi:hypothetical protein
VLSGAPGVSPAFFECLRDLFAVGYERPGVGVSWFPGLLDEEALVCQACEREYPTRSAL